MEPWYHDPVFGLTREGRYRQLIQGRGIAPQFVGRLTQNSNRIIGYLIESVNARAATSDGPLPPAGLSCKSSMT